VATSLSVSKPLTKALTLRPVISSTVPVNSASLACWNYIRISRTRWWSPSSIMLRSAGVRLFSIVATSVSGGPRSWCEPWSGRGRTAPYRAAPSHWSAPEAPTPAGPMADARLLHLIHLITALSVLLKGNAAREEEGRENQTATVIRPQA
jgi:hypothetical protein